MALQRHGRRLRLLVLASFLVVLGATLAAYLARRKPARDEAPPPAPIAADVDQQTQAFSLSKTLADHTLYTIRAEQVTNFRDTGKALLRGVSIVIYGKDGSRRDRITAAECEYDPAARSVEIPGEVEMQFDVPIPPSESAPSGAAPASFPITILTSALSFDQASGIAATDADVRFRSELGEGTSRGALYDPNDQSLILKEQVEFLLRNSRGREAGVSVPAAPPQEATRVRAGRLRFAREEGRAFLENAVEIEKGSRRVQAERGEIALDAAFRPQQALLEGDLRASDRAPEYFAEARGSRGRVWFDERGDLRSIELEQDVQWTTQALSSGALREGKAERVELLFEGPSTALTRVEAERDVQLILRNPARAPAGTQILTGQLVQMILSPDGKALQQVQVPSSPRLEFLPAMAGADHRTVTADTFNFRFDSEGNISAFGALGNVRVESEDTGSIRRRRVTKSDALEAAFDFGGALERIRQWGHFHYQDPERQAQAERADYSVREETIVLEGNPRVWNEQGRVEAGILRFGTRNGSLNAEGKVSSTYFPQPSGAGSSAEPLHVVADRMEYRSADDRAHYEGRARLWQGARFLLEADSLELRQKEHELSAQGRVFNVLRRPAATMDSKRSTPAPRSTPAVSFAIHSDTLLYRQEDRRAHYSGAIRLESDAGKLTAGELDIFFSSSSAAGPVDLSGGAEQMERVVAVRDVRILQGLRTASGDRAEYDVARNEVRLTGDLATITDPARGTAQGAQLTYFLADDSIQVEGKPGLPTETRWSVHP
jgi:LPS export ABC transporter protein LptC